jgi:hypothetical protein
MSLLPSQDNCDLCFVKLSIAADFAKHNRVAQDYVAIIKILIFVTRSFSLCPAF